MRITIIQNNNNKQIKKISQHIVVQFFDVFKKTHNYFILSWIDIIKQYHIFNLLYVLSNYSI